jgi:glycosyltransferase involved in cell wall biosynthesis
MKYGGIERVVQTLTLELLRQGHRVTLIAPPGSQVDGAEIIEASDFHEAAWALRHVKADIIHDHSCWSIHSPIRNLPSNFKTPFISTTHVQHAIGWTKNVVYLSNSQRDDHGRQTQRDTSKFPVIRVPTSPLLRPKCLPKEDYLLFLGTVSPHKGVMEAAMVAKQLGRKLIIAGPAWGEYPSSIRESFTDEEVEFVGEVGDPYRSQLIEKACAMMCLHNDFGGWLEPGCGVVGEAGAFNTPVAALPNGCLAEIVTPENGWLGQNLSDLIVQMKDLPIPLDFGRLARTEWNAETITKQYVQLYENVISGETWQ